MKTCQGSISIKDASSDAVSDGRSRRLPVCPSLFTPRGCFGQRTGSCLRGLRTLEVRWSRKAGVSTGAGWARGCRGRHGPTPDPQRAARGPATRELDSARRANSSPRAASSHKTPVFATVRKKAKVCDGVGGS